MIKQNKFEFGYGDISVGSDWNGRMSFQSIKPPTQVGCSIPEGSEYLNDEVILLLTYEECTLLERLLNNVINNNILVFELKNYVFDFTNYNIESVNVCLKHLDNTMSGYIMCMAC